jgi:hypothetical protein
VNITLQGTKITADLTRVAAVVDALIGLGPKEDVPLRPGPWDPVVRDVLGSGLRLPLVAGP